MIGEAKESAPLVNGKKNGRFVKGNPGGPGNPNFKKVQKLRAALVKAVSAESIARIAKKLITLAESGDVAATKELFDRVLGKSTQPIELNGEVAVTDASAPIRQVMSDPQAFDAAVKLADRLKEIESSESVN